METAVAMYIPHVTALIYDRQYVTIRFQLSMSSDRGSSACGDESFTHQKNQDVYELTFDAYRVRLPRQRNVMYEPQTEGYVFKVVS